MIPNVLSIAGSDPSGGAGIQADLKTFTALEVYGMATLTALTAQNTKVVKAVHPAPSDFIKSQLEAIFNDVRVDAVKIGMIYDAQSMHIVAEALKKYKPAHIVLDPVMVSTSGDKLQDETAIGILKSDLIPLASIITPNKPEAKILFEDENYFQAYNVPVLLKGGHSEGAFSTDILYEQSGETSFPIPRVNTTNTHGSGCTLSSALAVYLAKGGDLKTAVKNAKAYVTKAIQASDMLDVGQGHGPLKHF